MYVLPFGKAANGQDAHLYLLSNDNGMVVGVTDLGATLVSCCVPDGRGRFPDVTLGLSGAGDYAHNDAYLGALVGRCANRIAGAQFDLGGTTHHLSANERNNCLHSGPSRWSERLWKVSSSDDQSIVFELTSRKGDQGFPGTVQANVTYRLSEANQLMVYASAIPSEPTIINLVCHAYWNLNGHASGSILDHTLQVKADSYTPTDEQHIPTGKIEPVEGTPYDLRMPTALGAHADELPNGYDINLVLNTKGKMTQVARLVGDKTGIAMNISTDAPGIQVYTSGGLNVAWGKDGAHYEPFCGVALETQHYPDAIHHKDFPQPVYTTMRPFVRKTIFSFKTLEK